MIDTDLWLCPAITCQPGNAPHGALHPGPPGNRSTRLPNHVLAGLQSDQDCLSVRLALAAMTETVALLTEREACAAGKPILRVDREHSRFRNRHSRGRDLLAAQPAAGCTGSPWRRQHTATGGAHRPAQRSGKPTPGSPMSTSTTGRHRCVRKAEPAPTPYASGCARPAPRSPTGGSPGRSAGCRDPGLAEIASQQTITQYKYAHTAPYGGAGLPGGRVACLFLGDAKVQASVEVSKDQLPEQGNFIHAISGKRVSVTRPGRPDQALSTGQVPAGVRRRSWPSCPARPPRTGRLEDAS